MQSMHRVADSSPLAWDRPGFGTDIPTSWEPPRSRANQDGESPHVRVIFCLLDATWISGSTSRCRGFLAPNSEEILEALGTPELISAEQILRRVDSRLFCPKRLGYILNVLKLQTLGYQWEPS